MKNLFSTLALVLLALPTQAALQISSFSRSGEVRLTDVYTNGVATILAAPTVLGPWQPVKNQYTTNSSSQFSLGRGDTNVFYHAVAVELSPGRLGFTNLIESYGLLTTVAGAGRRHGRFQ